MYGVTAMAVWNGLGAGMIIFLAGLQGVPDELIEAAKIDGGEQFQGFLGAYHHTDVDSGVILPNRYGLNFRIPTGHA